MPLKMGIKEKKMSVASNFSISNDLLKIVKIFFQKNSYNIKT